MDESQWAIAELMGHVRYAGRLSEVERYGGKLARIDIPTREPCTCANTPQKTHVEACEKCGGMGTVPGFITKYFGASAVYTITFVTEEVARHAAKATSPAPISPWDFPKQLTAAAPVPSYEEIEREGEEDDDHY